MANGGVDWQLALDLQLSRPTRVDLVGVTRYHPVKGEAPAMRKALLGAVVFGCALTVATAAAEAVDWGTGFNDFRNACEAQDGVLNGNGQGSTCSYGGEVLNVPAASRGWTVDVAQGTVATWLGGSNVTEDVANWQVVACYNPGGQEMNLSHRHCVPR